MISENYVSLHRSDRYKALTYEPPSFDDVTAVEKKVLYFLNQTDMELTGKALKDFEEWLDFTHLNRNAQFIKSGLTPLSIRWGVYLEFFNSKGFEVEVNRVYDMGYEAYADEYEWGVGNFNTHKYSGDGWVKTLKEAQKEAIEKANQIYNGK